MGEKKKNIYKIAVSLLIAAAFIIPTASTLAGTASVKTNDSVGNIDAGVVQTNDMRTRENPEIMKYANGPVPLDGPFVPEVDIVDIKSMCKQGKIPEGTYPIDVVVLSTAPDPVPCKFFVEIYEKIEEQRITMYCTDFEDNCDIYNNWRTVDVDTAGNGCIDTWTLQTVRAHSGEHSFKNTMFDLYKGNQLDYLECTISFDVSWQEQVIVGFWAWVQGDVYYTDGYYVSADWLSFEIGDDTGLWYTIDEIWETSGWEYLEYVFDVAYLESLGLNIHDIMFRFDFVSDAQFQYEGAYVDDFCVYSVESYLRKVWQGHSQGEIMVPPCESQFVYPLPWTATEGHYQICAWLQCMDPEVLVSTPYDDPYCIQQKVGNQHDVAVIAKILDVDGVIIPCGGVAPAFHDLHIRGTVKNLGTMDETDVIVRAIVKKKYWETLFEDDMESGTANWQHWTFDTSDWWHTTTFDSYSPNTAWFWADQATRHYEDHSDGHLVTAANFDVNGAVHCYFDYYAKWAMAPGDEWMIDIYDPSSNYILGGYPDALVFPDPLAHGGCSDVWIGEMNPAGMYMTVDVLDVIDTWYAASAIYGAAFFGYPNGADYQFGIGFRTSPNGDGDYIATCDPGYWSGLLVDDCRIRAKFVGDEIWSDEVIVPSLKYGRPPENDGEEIEVQFEWEQMDFCNYQVCVEAIIPNDDHPENDILCNQIHVVTELEDANEKEIEGIDYTGEGEGHWTLSSSDYDRHMWIGDHSTTTYGLGWNDYVMIAPGGDYSLDLSGCGAVTLDYDSWVAHWPGHYYVVEVSPDVSTLSPTWTVVYNSVVEDGGWGWWAWVHMSLAIPGPYTSDMGIRFRFVSMGGTEVLRGVMLDNIDLKCDGGTIFFEDFGDCDTPEGPIWANWVQGVAGYGLFWHYCPTEDAWCFHDHDLGLPWHYPANVHNALIWSTEVLNAYEALLTFTHRYDLAPGDMGYLEFSLNGGLDWGLIDIFTGDSGGWVAESYDLTPWCGFRILIRFRILAGPTGGCHQGWCIDDLTIAGKKDHSEPASIAGITGNLKDSGWYNTAVTITVTATDTGSGVKEIHYKLDGVETVVPGDIATVSVSTNGDHTFEYWAVDNIGNVETTHGMLTFKIDKGAAPSVSITEPTPGLYLFGKKLLSASKIIIIGGFTVEATASDADSGVYAVEFFLDGESIGSDVQGPDYTAYCGIKNSGAATIKAVAEDFAQNTAEDTLDIVYYKFF